MSVKWTDEIKAQRGVVTGCDTTCEWMLKWWWGNYRRNNKYPVAFADFGMSGAMRAFCNKIGTVIDVTRSVKKKWFLKPFAMLATPFKKVVWIDIDCDVRKDLATLFNYIDNKVAVTKDPYTPFCRKFIKDARVVATGVVGASNGNATIVKWAKSVINNQHKLRGDQEALNYIMNDVENELVIMPPECQWLRRDGDNPDAIIMHWTGPRGKRKIKELMGLRVVSPDHGKSLRRIKPKIKVIRNKPGEIKKTIRKPKVRAPKARASISKIPETIRGLRASPPTGFASRSVLRKINVVRKKRT